MDLRRHFQFLRGSTKQVRRQDLLFLSGFVLLSFFYPLDTDSLSHEKVQSVKILDRNGVLLREALSQDEGYGQWTPLDAVDEKLVTAIVLIEDKRFYSHRGIDLQSLLRAMWQNVSTLSIVSGASTISQQTIKNIYHFPRTPFLKLIEMWMAVRLEYTLSKKEILEEYLNRIPFGNQTYGITSASQLYFGKTAEHLTWAESALLAGLPKSPTRLNPYRHRESALLRQQLILERIHASGVLATDEYERATAEALTLFPKMNTFRAPHFCDYVMTLKHTDTLQTTLDASLQDQAERIIDDQLKRFSNSNLTNASALVIDNRTGAILAMVGSGNYLDSLHDGQFNGVFSLRQPGSALKPFTYALAFEKHITPASVIPDIETIIPTAQGQFTPTNYDHQFHGPVRARVALACSYNIPAVRVAMDVGPGELLEKLRACGFESLTESAEYYGHGLTLGNGEVSLFEITRAYASLARGGTVPELSGIATETSRVKRTGVFSEATCFLISSILSDEAARASAFGYGSALSMPFPCAAKTGTSSDFRDNWTIGYTRDYTVGVWVGNFDNSPMLDISGITGAGMVFHEIMLAVTRGKTMTPFRIPNTVSKQKICSLSGKRPHAGCHATLAEYFTSGTEPVETCDWHDSDGRMVPQAMGTSYRDWLKEKRYTEGHSLSTQKSVRIIYPASNSVFKIDPNTPISSQALYFQASSNAKEIKWLLNGTLIGNSPAPFNQEWQLKIGKYKLRASLSESSLFDEVQFEVRK